MVARRIQRVRNKRGIKIKKCCSSCENIQVSNSGVRTCCKMLLKVEPCFTCPKWVMAQKYMDVGGDPAKVKSKAYLEYVQAVRDDESESIRQGIMTEGARKPILVIRREYELQFGSIYCML